MIIAEEPYILHDFRHYKIFMQWIFYPTLYISFKLATLYFDIKMETILAWWNKENMRDALD